MCVLYVYSWYVCRSRENDHICVFSCISYSIKPRPILQTVRESTCHFVFFEPSTLFKNEHVNWWCSHNFWSTTPPNLWLSFNKAFLKPHFWDRLGWPAMIPNPACCPSHPFPLCLVFFSWPGHAVVVVGLLSQPTEATLTVGESQVGGALGESWVIYVSPTTYFSGTRKLKFDKLTQKTRWKWKIMKKHFPYMCLTQRIMGSQKITKNFRYLKCMYWTLSDLFPAILLVGFPLRLTYRWGFLHLRYLKCLVKPRCFGFEIPDLCYRHPNSQGPMVLRSFHPGCLGYRGDE